MKAAFFLKNHINATIPKYFMALYVPDLLINTPTLLLETPLHYIYYITYLNILKSPQYNDAILFYDVISNRVCIIQLLQFNCGLKI